MGRSMEVSDAHQQVATASFPLEEASSRCRKTQQQQEQQQQQAKPQPEQSLKCPRCQSTNTKFCYYNNYSLSQPRYFCKACRRYWTKGGSLRNVPVGGGYRKNKKPTSSSSSSYSSNFKRTTLHLPFITNSNPPPPPPPLLPYNDLSLALASLHKQQHNYHENNLLLGNPSPELSCNNQSFLDTFRTGLLDDNIFCGYDEEGPGLLILPSTPTTATTVTASPQMESCKDSDREEDKMLMVDLQWQDNNGGDCNLALDSAAARDQYWTTNGVPSAWHGLINGTTSFV